MTDNHIHIGQFHDTCYDPGEIIRIVMESGMGGLVFSSTTSCIDDITYTEVEKEITGLFSHIPWSAEMVKPYLWYIPAYTAQGVTIEHATENIPYKGIKLHPLAHHWNLEDKKTMSILHGLFDYADQHNLPVLIHTGHSGVDRIKRREQIEMKKLLTIHDDNLGQNVDITISDSVFLPISKVLIIHSHKGLMEE